VNLESAGAGGRELLFQAGPRNRWIVEAYGRHVARPFGHSITQVLFQTGTIPGDTDYRIYRDFGDLPGVDFAIISNDWVYHTARDDVEHTDFRSVQRYGETAMSLVRGLAEALQHGTPTGAEAQEAAVYFDIAGVWFFSYSAVSAQKIHIAAAIVALTWVLFKSSRSGLVQVLRLVAALLAGLFGSILCAAFFAGALALSPAALVGSGHPELTPLLHVPMSCFGFVRAFQCVAAGSHSSENVTSASLVLAALICIVLSGTSTGVLASYPFFLWTASPLLADVLRAFLPACVGDVVGTAGYLLPWLLLAQLLILCLDLLCPLTMRSGTIVPGDVVIAAFYGLGTGLYGSLSARAALWLPWKRVKPMLGTALLVGVCLAMVTFPYNFDRPKRICMQHVARSATKWDLTARPAVPEQLPMESGLWMMAMDWNGVSTIEKHAPFSFPPGALVHDDSVGLYGEMPYPFPIKPFVANGMWLPSPAPELPLRLSLEVTSSTPQSAGARELTFSVYGGAHIRVAVGPRHLVAGWSLGHFAAKGMRHEAALPPQRPDCDCYWVLFSEGGEEPTNGRTEAFSFNLTAKPGELRLDLTATHLENESPEIRLHGSRMPHWVNFVGWVSEVQVHKIAV